MILLSRVCIVEMNLVVSVYKKREKQWQKECLGIRVFVKQSYQLNKLRIAS